jgi:hypothetical protein
MRGGYHFLHYQDTLVVSRTKHEYARWRNVELVEKPSVDIPNAHLPFFCAECGFPDVEPPPIQP